MKVVCVNDLFTPEWVLYFAQHEIETPVAGQTYTVRHVVKYPAGEQGILLKELQNKPTPRISPTTGMHGMAEQAWGISRFADEKGNPIINLKINAQ